ncbi:MAG: hypothetical protein A3J48_02755 [Candidatus Doudnabacteria bacterium RIFCSPHIGHO2_02_FULL_46_11]|uniref:RNase H type-1 domain-containing protein n=1 Tax=Candidatus Doudnabacteria bacterium RIFCSPHIGHO2_02_FULL_46_11 TaxID=1817832 RepID=A0A1F5P608_9BACT|nr:MAG: hypothetical protein A3J48_02755 [Candidatus Doudnabacteria bacterium RIFCSPHIGHO2_02_FULL_46_11]
MKINLYTDGGSRNNPGPAGVGGVAFDESGEEIFRFKKFLGEKTNNQAEYLALIEGLRIAELKGYQAVECFLDSELVVKQLSGLYKIKHPDIQPLVAEVLKLKNKFKSISFKHVLREKNKTADSLVNEAIDEGLS